jgi:glutamate racemase
LKPAAALSKTGVIGVMATRGTLNSEKFRKLLEGTHGGGTFVLQPCDGLADAIERFDATRIQSLCGEYTRALGSFGNAVGEIDCLVLGCTHYAFVTAELTALVGKQINLLEGGAPVARQTRRLLNQCDPSALNQSPLSHPANPPTFYSTGSVSLLESAVQRWLDVNCETQALQLD